MAASETEQIKRSKVKAGTATDIVTWLIKMKMASLQRMPISKHMHTKNEYNANSKQNFLIHWGIYINVVCIQNRFLVIL